MKRADKNRGSGKKKDQSKVKAPRWKKELAEIESITTQYEPLGDVATIASISEFDDIPLSSRTRRGLEEAGFSVPTAIQKQGIPSALLDNDILGAAKTGSGKTLAFLVPVLEKLWRERWTSYDGLGALLISPTRELAYQTFEVLRKVGKHHDFSGGLVIGGKDLKAEKKCIHGTNIVVCTPGRLLQHMDETASFDCANLKVVVLDEADRILDLGFASAVNAIIENLPVERQTLLYSATQTKSVQDLARLSLKTPKYISTYEKSAAITPNRLTQNYIVCDLPQKLSILYSFVHSHAKCKSIIFFSSCKQVKFTYEVFRRLRPGVPLMALYGKQKQLRRVATYNDFCGRASAVLFCTDIAARGLDFPAVHWVIQADCPEDANTYIHRAGRTARVERDGQALLFLLPSEEEKFVEQLKKRKVPIGKIEVNPKKLRSIQGKLEAFCAQDNEVKHWAQKSFISYVRSVFLQSNKEVFNVQSLPLKEYALSLGLIQPPRIRFLKKMEKKIHNSLDSSADEGEDTELHSDAKSGPHKKDGISEQPLDEDDGDFLKIKRKILPGKTTDEEPAAMASRKRKTLTKVSQSKTLVHKKLKLNTHVIFDENNDDLSVPKNEAEADTSESEEESGGIDIAKAKRLIKIRDEADRKKERERVRNMHKMRKQPKQSRGDDIIEEALLGSLEEQETSMVDNSKDFSSMESMEDSPSEACGFDDGLLNEDEQLVLHLLSKS